VRRQRIGDKMTAPAGGAKTPEAAVDDYPEPVKRLLTLGEPDPDRWPDHRAMGLGPEHVPDLIRLATDPVRYREGEEGPEIWGPVQAWYALGQLRAAEAVPPLLNLLNELEEIGDDRAFEDLPTVLARIGLPALPALKAFLAASSGCLYALAAAVEGMVRLAQEHPEARAEVVAALTERLEHAAENDPSLNGFLLSALLDLKAVESAPVIRRACEAALVDESIAGGWPEAEHELGLTDKPPPRRRFDYGLPPLGGLRPPTPRKKAEERKEKRRMAAESRKRNRKKKKKR